MTRAIVIGAFSLFVVAAFFVLRNGDDPFTVEMRLANAGGLRDGSPVVVGGVPIGKVRLDADHAGVDVKLDIERKHAPIGKDATAAIIAQNVLGQKQVRVDLGDKANPAPEGYKLPSRQVTETTDLDQLLSTLDPDTRTRLAILANETGTAFAGRKLDFKNFLVEFAPSLSSGSELLGQLTRDNRALTSLLTTSDRYIAALAPERRRLSRMLDLVGRTTETVAARRGALRETLRSAPGALTSAQSFLAELRRTTGPLASTSRTLAATAPSLRATLERIEPFRRAAAPALASASDKLGPALARLGDKAAKPFARSLPALTSVKAVSQNEIPPVGGALEKSMDNILATIENWSRAIQFRDGMGHVFRGEASFAPDFYDSIISRLGGKIVQTPKARSKRRKSAGPLVQQAPAPSAPATKPQTKLPEPLKKLPEQLKKLDEQLKQLPGSLPALPPLPKGDGKDIIGLLDFLLSN